MVNPFASPFGTGGVFSSGGGFSTSTTLPSALSYLPVFNVASNGGEGDGVTDNYALIRQAIIDANALGGGTVYLGPGTWMVSNIPFMRSNVTLMGAGRQTTILKATDTYASTSLIAIPSNTTHDVRVCDLTLDMNAGSIVANRSKTPVAIGGGYRITLERIGVQGVRHDGTNGCNAIKFISSGTVPDVPGNQFVLRDFYVKVDYVLGPGAVYVGASAGYVKGANDVVIESGVIDYTNLVNTTAGTAFAYGICVDLKQPSAMDPNRHSQRVRIRDVQFTSPPAPALIQYGTAADVYATGLTVTGATTGRDFSSVTTACYGFVSSLYPDYTYRESHGTYPFWTFSGSGLSATPTYSINFVVENSVFESATTSAYACAVSDGGTGGGSKARGIVFRNVTGRNCYGALVDGIGTLVEDCDFEGPYDDSTNGITVLGTAVGVRLRDNSLRGHYKGYDVASGATDTRIRHGYHSALTNSVVADAGTRTQSDGFGLSARGSVSVADGGTITHNLAMTPRWARVQTSVSGEFASVTTLGSTTLTVALKKHDGTAGTTQTVYWEAGY